MTDQTDRVIARVCEVGSYTAPDIDSVAPLSPDERNDTLGAEEYAKKADRDAPIGGPGEPEPQPFDDTAEHFAALDDELENFEW